MFELKSLSCFVIGVVVTLVWKDRKRLFHKKQVVYPNVDILKSLNYYGLNICNEKKIFIKYMKDHLGGDTVNHSLNFTLYWKYCVLGNQMKTYLDPQELNEMTASNTLEKFIENSIEYKKFEMYLNYRLSRSIQLSKYVYDEFKYNLLYSLTKDELLELYDASNVIFST